VIVTVPSQRAEDAADLLMRTLGSHRTRLAGLAPAVPSRLRATRTDRVQVACQSTLIRFASITEAYCADALVEAAEQLAQPGRARTMQTIWDEAAVAATRTWNDQKSAYKTWLGVTISWATIDAVADARNAVAHGLGSLTRQQMRKRAAVDARLAQLGVALVGRDLELNDASLQGVALKCRDFIFALDGKVQARLQAP
jgi:hypothetical protein